MAIIINGVTIPEPVRQLKIGQPYFVVVISNPKLVRAEIYDGYTCEQHILKCGLAHLTSEDATTHGNALLTPTFQE